MEYILLAIVLIQGGFIAHLLIKAKPTTLSEEQVEIDRKEKIEKSWQKLFNYNEDIATRGYKE